MGNFSVEKKKKILAKCALFLASIIWGSSFILMKNSVGVFPTHILLGIRFTIGCFLLALIFHKRLKYINKGFLWRGAIMGLLLFLAYSTQTIGLSDTTPGKNAFLTAVYCVIVPFLFWAINKERPDSYDFSAAILCIAGIGFVSLAGGFKVNAGDAFTLIGGFFYAAHIVAVSKCTKGHDPILLTILQFFFAAIFSWIVGLSLEQFPTNVGRGAIFELVYLAVFATAGALLLQNVGQKYENPSTAAIILSLESVFGVLFSVIFYHEQMTVRLVMGFLLIFCAILLSQTKLSFLKPKEKKEESL